MAKKIVLTFVSNPIAGDTFQYDIAIGTIPLIYENGFNTVDIAYTTIGTPNTLDPFTIGTLDLKARTIKKTFSFLSQNFVSPIVLIETAVDVITITVDTDQEITIDTNSSAAITMTVEDLEPVTPDVPGEISTTNGLRYFFRYTNIVGDNYLCKIYKKGNSETPIEIHGTATIDKGSVKDHLDTIRGTGLSLELEATTLLTLEDLYSQDEQDFQVQLYKNNTINFVGFLKPDGVFQSFVDDKWVLSLDCIDGLGALANLSFVQLNGLHFTDKMTASDIIYNCLKRTGIFLPINTSINVLYDGLTPSSTMDILTKIKVNTERFYNNDEQYNQDRTIMSCEVVLKSILDIFCANITQENGQWYIYKANEIFENQTVIFRNYDLDNVFVGNVTLNLSQDLGSQVDTYYPHHCKGDQKIEIKGGLGAFRLGYKYGFVKGLFDNPNFQHGSILVFPDYIENWTVSNQGSSFMIYDPLDENGVKFNVDEAQEATKLALQSQSIPLLIDDSFEFKVTFKTNGGSVFNFKIRLGSYYLTNNGEWSLTDQFVNIRILTTEFGDSPMIVTKIFSIKTNPLPVTGNVYVEVYVPKKLAYPGTKQATKVEIDSINLVNAVGNSAIQGEFHTVTRKNKVSTIVKENKSVSNGDNAGIIYLGAIFKEDGTTPTSTWFRSGTFESKPLLRIAAEEELRINQKPMKVFKGSIYGYVPYLSVVDINNVNGLFMAIEHTYDTKTNITKVKLLELFSSELSDIVYKYTLDYGNTVKPTITS